MFVDVVSCGGGGGDVIDVLCFNNLLGLVKLSSSRSSLRSPSHSPSVS